jgi:hypothetical protein
MIFPHDPEYFFVSASISEEKKHSAAQHYQANLWIIGFKPFGELYRARDLEFCIEKQSRVDDAA